MTIASVADGWSTVRLKRVCRLAYGDSLAGESRDGGSVPVYGSNGRVGHHSVANTLAPCIVVGRKGSFGKVNFSSEPVFAIDTTYWIDSRCTTADLRWLFYVLTWLRLDAISKDSAIPGLDRGEAYECSVPLPPLAEQRSIVRFLDHADRRIRRAIRAKQKLIALLNEQKQAVIHRAVTRGLHPNVRLKPSGVEWLGDVPEHWDVKRLKSMTRFRNGFAFKPTDWGDVGVPIIRIQNLNGSDAFNFTTRVDVPAHVLVKPGDLLFAWSGNRGTSFGSFVWDRSFDGYLNQHIFKLESYELNRRYFTHLLRAVTRHVEEQAHGIIGLVHITKPDLGAIAVPVASPAEQQAIAAYIDEQLARTDAVATAEKRSVELLREYRTRLIADVVTGKLDVREAAARMPDEVDELEPLDEDDVEPAEEAGDYLEPVEA